VATTASSVTRSLQLQRRPRLVLGWDGSGKTERCEPASVGRFGPVTGRPYPSHHRADADVKLINQIRPGLLQSEVCL